MVDAILEFFNTSGTATLTQLGKQMVLKNKGRHNVTTGAVSASIGTRSTLTLSCSASAIIALRPVSVNIACGIYYSTYANGQRSFGLMTEGGTNQQIDWWLFDVPTSYDPGNDVRFELNKADGTLAWHLYTNPMKIITAFFANNVADAQNITLPAGSIYAVAPGNPSGVRQDTPQPPFESNQYRTQMYWDAVARTDTNIGFGLALLDQESFDHDGDNGSTNYGPRNALVIDVSNL